MSLMPLREKMADAAASPWQGFRGGVWQTEINVRDFIQQNYHPYDGDAAFLAPATTRTKHVWATLKEMVAEERRRGVRDVCRVPSSITSHAPGYIDRNREIIVGLQAEAPLARTTMPRGALDKLMDVSTAEMRRCRRSNILNGLPDAYSRGRIAGDYRRVALYGTARLIAGKRQDKDDLDTAPSTESILRDREELAEQIHALEELGQMAASYEVDISAAAVNATEAVQWMYFAYLAGVKEQAGAAVSLGRASNFLDIYFERDLVSGALTEYEAQEIIDDFIIKLRIVRFLRSAEYEQLFAGDPAWVTESIGGMADDGRPLVTKTSFRFLQTLYNLGAASEPNLTIWYSPRLPVAFRRFAAQVALETSAIHFESDEIMRPAWGDDAGLVCCVSPTVIGKEVQFFGGSANLVKCLLYAINGGRDEITGEQIGPPLAAVAGDDLDFDDVIRKFDKMMEWLAGVYVAAMNTIHAMHDKYAYERIEMALHDCASQRSMAFGLAGLSVVADSLSAIKYAKCRVVRDATGLAIDYRVDGVFPSFGNNDNRVDQLACWLVSTFISKLRKYPTYRNASHTLSLLTMTANRVYGESTGNTPDGRRRGEPFASGANPMYGRDTEGIHASAMSIAKIPCHDAAGGLSLAASLVPTDLGHVDSERITNLTAILDGLFSHARYHVTVNVLSRATLVDAMDHPEKYPDLIVRISGRAVDFTALAHEQQLEVINRTTCGASRHV